MVIAVLAVLAIVIETTAILTSFPYGHFDYSDLLGFKLFGVTPWTVAFAWSPLVIGAHAVAARYFDSFWLRVPVIAILLTAFDLVLDPGAVRLGFWRYAESEGFYGVPLSNFAGWRPRQKSVQSLLLSGAFYDGWARGLGRRLEMVGSTLFDKARHTRERFWSPTNCSRKKQDRSAQGKTCRQSCPMSTQSRDSIALYIIAALAVLATMYADIDLGEVFRALLARV